MGLAHNYPNWEGLWLLSRRGKLILIAGIGIVAVYATWPGRATLNYGTCEPMSGLSQFSAMLYGRFFWEKALARADELAASFQELDRDLRKTFDDAKASRERSREIIQDPSEHTAQWHRDQADQIEEREAMNLLSSMHQEGIETALRCKRVIAEKLRGM